MFSGLEDSFDSLERKVKESSQKRIEANRRNAQKSTGPKTPEGKARSSLNALRHGERAYTTLLPHEDEGMYQIHCEGFYQAMPPKNAIEAALLDDAIASAWRLKRTIRNQTAQLNQKVYDAVNNYHGERHKQLHEWIAALPTDVTYFIGKIRGTSSGCHWAIGKLSLMIETLKIRTWLYPSEMDTILYIFGCTTQDIFRKPLAHDLFRDFVVGGWNEEVQGRMEYVQALIRTHAPEGFKVWEYRDRVKRFAAATSEGDVEAARRHLIEKLLAEIALLKEESRLAMRCEDFLFDQVQERAMVDLSPDEQTRSRYEAMHRRDLRRTLGDLRDLRKALLNDEIGVEVTDFENSDPEMEIAPNEPISIDRPTREFPETPVTGVFRGEKTKTPTLDDDEHECKKRLGMPPVPFEELNSLIDESIPDLNGLLRWADELEAAEKAKADADESVS